MNINKRERGFCTDRFCSILGMGAAILGGSLVSGLLGQSSANNATSASNAASKASLAEQKRQFDLGRRALAPYRKAGLNALNEYKEGISPNTNMYGSFQNDSKIPQFQGGDRYRWDQSEDAGFQFTRDQALQATERQQNAGGNQFSGNILAALQDRAGGVAAQYSAQQRAAGLGESQANYGRGLTEYQTDNARNRDMYGRALGQYGLDVSRNTDAYGRDQNYLNQLGGLASSGQNAATQSGNLGANYANTASNTMMGNAANTGQLAMQGANSLNNAVQSGIGNALQYNYLQNNPWRPTDLNGFSASGR